MTDYNKTSLMQGAVMLALALVLFFTIIAFIFLVKAGVWWTTIIPGAAIVYAIIVFVKTYYPKK